MNEKTTVVPFFTDKLYLPSMSEVVPIAVPFIAMETPGSVLLSLASVTLPLIFTSCAFSCSANKKPTKRNSPLNIVDCFSITDLIEV